MSYVLWFFAALFILETLNMLRVKHSLRQLKTDFSKFKNNDEYVEVPRSHATKKMQKYIAANLSQIELAGYKLMSEHTKPKCSMLNHYVLFVSNTNDSIIELVYLKYSPIQRLFFALFLSKYCFKSEIFAINAETNFTNQETFYTATINPAVFPNWVHANFLELDKSAKDVIKLHNEKVSEYELSNKVERKQVRNMEDFIEIQAENRKRLSQRLDSTYEEIVNNNNLEWLVKDTSEEKNI
jgi:hypothetical protein